MHTLDLFKMSASEWADKLYDCDCGRKHPIDIKHIALEDGAINRLEALVEPYKGEDVLVICDQNTLDAAGNTVLEKLSKAGVSPRVSKFETGDKALLPDERAVGKVMLDLRDDTGLLIAAGSGTLGDLTRFVSARAHIPYIAVATAASMDGYASNNSPMIIGGKKVTLITTTAHAIVADPSIFGGAPVLLTQAGYGDVIGKITARADWLLSHKVNGEYRCECVASLVEEAVERCFASADGIKAQDPKAAFDNMYALLFTGVAMNMVGISRPASGAEHHFSHYWEMAAIAKGQEHPLHGHMVGAATPVVAAIYELLDMRGREGVSVMSYKDVRAHLADAGCAEGPKELGIPLELFQKSVLHANEVRNRYTVLQYALDRNLLAGLVEPLTERFY